MSAEAYQKLLRWHWDIAARIAADELLAGIPVTAEFPEDYFNTGGQMVQRIELMMAAVTGSVISSSGKSGLLITVWCGEVIGQNDKSTSLTFKVKLRVIVIESRKYNSESTGFAPLNGAVVAGIIADNLQNFSDGGVVGAARPEQINSDHSGWLPPEMRKNLGDEDFVHWGMEIDGLIKLPSRPKLYPPRITIATGNATLTPPTQAPSAAIRYTLDGSYPGLTAAVYGPPVAINPGQTIRAVAVLTGFNESDLVEQSAS